MTDISGISAYAQRYLRNRNLIYNKHMTSQGELMTRVIIIVIGVLKAGRACIPVETGYPKNGAEYQSGYTRALASTRFFGGDELV